MWRIRDSPLHAPNSSLSSCQTLTGCSPDRPASDSVCVCVWDTSTSIWGKKRRRLLKETAWLANVAEWSSNTLSLLLRSLHMEGICMPQWQLLCRYASRAAAFPDPHPTAADATQPATTSTILLSPISGLLSISAYLCAAALCNAEQTH